MRTIIIISLLIFVIACAPVDTPPTDTPGQATCYGFTDSDILVSYNPCLQPPYTIDTSNPIIQQVPDGWQIINIIENVRGHADNYSDYAKIICGDGIGCNFDIYNSVGGIDGQWGYEQTIELEPGCYLGKISGRGYINDPPHPDNFAITTYYNDVEISQQVIPLQDGFELIYPFEIAEEGAVSVRFMAQALWATAGHESSFDILSIGVLRVGYGFCSD